MFLRWCLSWFHPPSHFVCRNKVNHSTPRVRYLGWINPKLHFVGQATVCQRRILVFVYPVQNIWLCFVHWIVVDFDVLIICNFSLRFFHCETNTRAFNVYVQKPTSDNLKFYFLRRFFENCIFPKIWSRKIIYFIIF